MSTAKALRSSRPIIAFAAAAALAAIALIAAGTTPAEAETADGVLEVLSSPDVATQILVGDVVRNTSRISGLSLSAGEYLVCFSAPAGYLAPPCEKVTMQDGVTSRVTGSFPVAGRLAVAIEPESLQAGISVDGVLRDRGAIEIPITLGRHEVCFEALTGYLTPDCQQVDAGTDGLALVHASYRDVPEPTVAEPTEPAPVEPEVQVPTTEQSSWKLGGKTTTREHPITVAEGDVKVRVDFTRADTVSVALVDSLGRHVAGMSGQSGMNFLSSVPSGDYRITVTGSRAHYELAVTAHHAG